MCAPCLHLDGLVNDLDTPIFFELPPTTITTAMRFVLLISENSLSLPGKSWTPSYRTMGMLQIELVLFSIARRAFVPQRGGYGCEKKDKKN